MVGNVSGGDVYLVWILFFSVNFGKQSALVCFSWVLYLLQIAN